MNDQEITSLVEWKPEWRAQFEAPEHHDLVLGCVADETFQTYSYAFVFLGRDDHWKFKDGTRCRTLGVWCELPEIPMK